MKHSAVATIPAETRAFLIIAPHPSLLLVALPCDSWLQILQHLTLQLQISAPFRATPPVTPPLLETFERKRNKTISQHYTASQVSQP